MKKHRLASFDSISYFWEIRRPVAQLYIWSFWGAKVCQESEVLGGGPSHLCQSLLGTTSVVPSPIPSLCRCLSSESRSKLMQGIQDSKLKRNRQSEDHETYLSFFIFLSFFLFLSFFFFLSFSFFLFLSFFLSFSLSFFLSFVLSFFLSFFIFLFLSFFIFLFLSFFIFLFLSFFLSFLSFFLYFFLCILN